jgi:hypothetical protein
MVSAAVNLSSNGSSSSHPKLSHRNGSARNRGGPLANNDSIVVAQEREPHIIPESQLVPPEIHRPNPPMLTKSGRAVRVPSHFGDELPINTAPTLTLALAPHVARRVTLHVRDSFRSVVNLFNVLREYHHRPSYDPDAHLKPEDLANFTVHTPLDDFAPLPAFHPPPPWPFENMTKYLLMNWFHTGGNQKSEGEVNRLVKEVISASDFIPGDLAGFTVRQENKALDNSTTNTEGQKDPSSSSSDNWQELSVDIEVPVPVKNTPPRIFTVPGFHRRSIVSVIKATWGLVSSSSFHLTPFKRYHVDPSNEQEQTRIYDEVYTSDAWIEAHDKLQKDPNEPDCKLEKVIAGLMFWSDSTHLTNFGTASVWPLYMYFGNLSKYIRARPNSGACHHIAYIPYVSFASKTLKTCH